MVPSRETFERTRKRMRISGERIIQEVKSGHIVIDPFDPKRVNPNSYNLRLDRVLKVYDFSARECLDPREENAVEEWEIPADGMILRPGILYLGSTIEWTEALGFIPQLDGRSSFARLGLRVHATAGFGDHGFRGRWTLEIDVVYPVRVYPELEICQISFEPLLHAGEHPDPSSTAASIYRGKYQDQKKVQESLQHIEKKKKK